MTGQMPGGKMDIVNLWVTEPADADAPADAIPQGGEFTLHAQFTGSGTQWNNMKKQGHIFVVYFHVEGVGATEAEVDYGPVNVTLNQATNIYEVTRLVPAPQNKLPIGLYNWGCTIEDTNWHGAVAFLMGKALQIYTP